MDVCTSKLLLLIVCYALAQAIPSTPGKPDVAYDQYEPSISTEHNIKKRTMDYPEYLWKDGKIWYVWADDLEDSAKVEIEATMALYEYFTPIRFHVWSNANGTSSSKNYNIFIRNPGVPYCYSEIGLRKLVAKTLCCHRQVCLHEIGHLVGIYHEMTRHDQGSWIQEPSSRSLPSFPSAYISTWTGNYDIHNYMHYRYKLEGSQILFHIIPEETLQVQNNYYMFREMSMNYNFSEYPQCQNHKLDCVNNDGYVSVVNNKCTCVCPHGLDPSTGCKTITKHKVSSSMPRGDYSIPAPPSGNCPHGFKKTTLKTQKSAIDLCSKTDLPCIDGDTSCDWPAGSYCFLKGTPNTNGSCPTGLGLGERQLNSSIGATNIPHFCCIENSFTHLPTVFPIREDFSLFKNIKYGCQKIEGMHVEETSYPLSDDMSSPLSPYVLDHNLTICNYRPLDMDCGGIIEFNETSTTVTIESSKSNPSLRECTWLFKGNSEDGVLVLDFDEFNVTANEQKNCIDRVVVRPDMIGQEGVIYCGTTVKKSITSNYNMMMMRFLTTDHSKSHFKATVTWKPGNTWCYNSKDRGMSYGGKVNYTRHYKPCLHWSELDEICLEHRRDEKFGSVLLDGNYCRNPDDSARPWCYVKEKDENCYKRFCDVCGFGKAYDNDGSSCATLEKQNICKDPKEAATRCAKTCKITPTVQKGITRGCKNPGNIRNGNPKFDLAKRSFSVGAKVTYECKQNKIRTVERLCLSSGKWTAANTACIACPLGFVSTGKKCFMIHKDAMGYSDGEQACWKLNSSLAIIKNRKENDFLQSYMKAARVRVTYLNSDIKITENQTIVLADGSTSTFDATLSGRDIKSLSTWDDDKFLAFNFPGVWFVRDKFTFYKNYHPVCEKSMLDKPDCANFHDDCEDRLHATNFGSTLGLQNLCRLTDSLCDKDEDNLSFKKYDDLTYAGKVDFTARFQSPCAHWKDAIKCKYNPYNLTGIFKNLDENYCRNPDKSSRPWCYTDVNKCQRKFCDVGFEEKPIDNGNDCAQVKSRGDCQRNRNEALRCAASCYNELIQPVKKVSEMTCNFQKGNITTQHAVGERVMIKCQNSDRLQEKVCISDGSWTVSSSECYACPLGFRQIGNKCYRAFDPYDDVPRGLNVTEYCLILGSQHISLKNRPKLKDELQKIFVFKYWYFVEVCGRDPYVNVDAVDSLPICGKLLTNTKKCDESPDLSPLCPATCNGHAAGGGGGIIA